VTDVASAGDRRPTVLVVDDTPDDLHLISGLLRNRYSVKLANRGDKAIEIARSNEPPDIVLLDILMSDMDGYQVLKALKEDSRTQIIPVILLTGISDMDDEQKGFDLGAADFITKPVSPPLLWARVATHLGLKRVRTELDGLNEAIGAEVERRMAEAHAVYDVTITALGSLAETRDDQTINHIRRTQRYVRAVAMVLRDHPRFASVLDEGSIELIYRAVPLHDIGKIGIPDSILLKPGRLTRQEFEVIKSHTTIGRDAILTAERALGAGSPFLRIAAEIACSHQEKWDGSGYPEGLSGEDIPVPARLMAIADVYDSIISHRIYRNAMSHDDAIRYIRDGRGSHFDPDIVDAFLGIEDEIRRIAEAHPDPVGEDDGRVIADMPR